MFKKLVACGLLAFTLFSASFAGSNSIILATTTSTVDSGLLDVLLPIFEKQSGCQVKPIGVGSGMAMEMGRRGKADVLLVHSPKDEVKLVQDGFGLNRRAVMHNDFILLGPPNDPARARLAKTVGEAFKKISESGSLFISRGDRSGTHAKELSIWPYSKAQLSNLWYLESGQGMGATLLIADQKRAYTLADRATYLSFKERLKLVIIAEGDQLLLNPYHVIEVNPEKWPEINSAGGKAFADFMVAPATQKKIAEFGREKYRQSLFFPDAK
ncbi:tungsten ABC transporter substrate-binding protein [candidate division WOR-1 bacterium RIFOXYA12_FULL_52_29]|uniref:Tungsten ABC transporter substrate-binding protein n=1 Tax=candidate division WOR-1 bacterium RIFOXYC12_FULL_54_18 TaxID=1802584 RepID=A0A1F4T4Q4_UNCSA|nr:MAG: tungsten ABC transporter substrate-binding protein [candidate division WOR-1 bacterium RIFOXYA2_FULL_51_19]OGC17271.1 MAG: tungsten ABC transporter substrate-binding protein [candidate division WOR-1 bacterium RIFOXYA12_FULL_52_29]OGC26131.1 MAG: tungsten ABC transporter substrate-binding protein [candidate division WOR-1 bacterium RIFOXYB2_FULL_45_9]OGC27688.1 MAG: tungsten ABC transporter substrate-binding protein [candidate division WOR-1 bacterium RIFOXYC12_FULL_54_18]OGC30021.1 MAG